MRCLPPFQGAELYYADAGCTDALVLLQPCDTSKMITVTAGDECQGVTASTYRLGSAVANDTPTAVYSRDGHGACTSTGTVSGASLYHLGAEQPATDFVSAEAKDDPLDGVIGLRRLVAEDGAEETRGLFDVARGTDCAMFGDGSRCIPAISAYESADVPSSTLYTDASCSTVAHVARVVSTSAACSPDPGELGIRLGPADACGALPKEIHRINKEVSQSSYYALDPVSGCFRVTIDSTGYELGEAVPLDAFPALSMVDRGIGRLRVKSYADSAGTPVVRRDGFVDTEQQRASCWPIGFSGGIRCAPNPVFQADFADASCTEPVGASFKDPSCQGSAPSSLLENVGDVCDATFRAYQRGDEVPLTTVYWSDEGMCTGFPADPEAVYTSLTPFDETAWGAMTLRTE